MRALRVYQLSSSVSIMYDDVISGLNRDLTSRFCGRDLHLTAFCRAATFHYYTQFEHLSIYMLFKDIRVSMDFIFYFLGLTFSIYISWDFYQSGDCKQLKKKRKFNLPTEKYQYNQYTESLELPGFHILPTFTCLKSKPANPFNSYMSSLTCYEMLNVNVIYVRRYSTDAETCFGLALI